MIKGQNRPRAPRSAVGLVLALTLGGCAHLGDWRHLADLPAQDLPMTAHGAKVIVRLQWPGDDPEPTAQHYCAQMGRWAQLRTLTNTSASFDCVEDPATRPANPAGAGPR
ncbi:MAG: hypothetical protein JWP86_112 [Phenylobacterium sp.]|nr:hypothetical protein [Phenylobacterium sp.]